MKNKNSKQQPLQSKDVKDKNETEKKSEDAFSGKEETPSGLHEARQKALKHKKSSLHIPKEDQQKSA